MSLCQTCTEHNCNTPAWLEEVTECEQYKPPYGFIKCDTCHTPTTPFSLHRVRVEERTLLVCPECVQRAVEHWVETIKEAAQEATLESAGGEKDVPAGW